MNSKTLFAILSILLSAVAIWFLVLPAYQSIKDKNARYKEKEEEIKKTEASVVKLESLVKSSEEKKDKVEIVLEMSPKGKNIPKLLNQMDSLVSQSGVVLYAMTFGDSQSKDASDSRSVQSASGAVKTSKALKVDFKLSGTYEAFKNLLADLEKNSRLADVQNFGFSGKSETVEASSLYDFGLSAIFYYR